MSEHLSECCVSVPSSRNLIETVSQRFAEFCVSIVDDGMEKTFKFIDGEAVVRAVGRGILMRVVATDVISYYGIRTALEGSILKLTALEPEEFAWYPAGESPFAAVGRVHPSQDEVHEREKLATAEVHHKRLTAGTLDTHSNHQH
ncbi:SMa0974 family conjugal transfer regulator [Sinorhizobium meliloti]|uniref:SMa0974 family conjugal transfer regulator n=1 Tax=Rhizobium meliloti TaxID=382 RepID=UPI0026C546DC